MPVKPRDVQTSLLEGMARPVGRLPQSVMTGTNADLIRQIAPLYLTGSVLDVTYGEGGWWRSFRPEGLVAHDLHKLDGIDFRDLPHPDRSFDTVCFDPPYIPQGGTSNGGAGEDRYRKSFGLVQRSEAVLWDLIGGGLRECARVSRGFLLVKCMDFVNGGRFFLGHRRVMDLADELGLTVHDLIVHNAGTGPGGHNIYEAKRARRAHSYLLVFDASAS
jgi:hypothetical protein